MKKILFLSSLTALCFSAAQAQNPVTITAAQRRQSRDAVHMQKTEAPKDMPEFQFTEKEDTHDFGKIPEGPSVTYVFTFKNTGKAPLLISNGNASCGCTSPKWPAEPILPGKTGKITVEYRTADHPGPFTKTVYLTSNAPAKNGGDKYELYIKGEVTPKAPATH